MDAYPLFWQYCRLNVLYAALVVNCYNVCIVNSLVYCTPDLNLCFHLFDSQEDWASQSCVVRERDGGSGCLGI